MKTSEPDGSSVIRQDHAHAATFNWAIDRIDTLTDLGHHRFKEKLSIIDVSNGTTHLRDSQTLPNEAPFTSTSVDCTVVSTRHRFTRTRTAITGVQPPKKPPKATVSWSVPVVADENGTYIFDGTPFDESRSAVDRDAPGVTQHCVDNSVAQRYIE